jgi:hypothetical protein
VSEGILGGWTHCIKRKIGEKTQTTFVYNSCLQRVILVGMGLGNTTSSRLGLYTNICLFVFLPVILRFVSVVFKVCTVAEQFVNQFFHFLNTLPLPGTFWNIMSLAKATVWSWQKV